ncbi:hypothetical protein OIV83_005773 [Microbotryomycetes sp. JL201]|nr:hypothetical protein OIV83_005773 [Microbotryomycetes sp. JL201]
MSFAARADQTHHHYHHAPPPAASSSMISDDDLLADLDSFQLESHRDQQLSAMASLLKGVLPDAPAHAHDHPSTMTATVASAKAVPVWPRQQRQANEWAPRPGPPAPSSSYIGSPSWATTSANNVTAAQAAAMGGLTPYGTPMNQGTLPLPDHADVALYNSNNDEYSNDATADSMHATRTCAPQQTRYSLRSSVRQMAAAQEITRPNSAPFESTGTGFNVQHHHYQSPRDSSSYGPWSTLTSVTTTTLPPGTRAPCASRERPFSPTEAEQSVQRKSSSVTPTGARPFQGDNHDDDDDDMTD